MSPAQQSLIQGNDKGSAEYASQRTHYPRSVNRDIKL